MPAKQSIPLLPKNGHTAMNTTNTILTTSMFSLQRSQNALIHQLVFPFSHHLRRPGRTRPVPALPIIRHGLSIVSQRSSVPIQTRSISHSITQSMNAPAVRILNSLEQDPEHVALHDFPSPMFLCEISAGLSNLSPQFLRKSASKRLSTHSYSLPLI